MSSTSVTAGQHPAGNGPTPPCTTESRGTDGTGAELRAAWICRQRAEQVLLPVKKSSKEVKGFCF